MPRAVGVRREFADVPPQVRAWVEDELGSRVVSARTQVGGMSPGCAARVRTASGATAFVKAVGPYANEGTKRRFRLEIVVLGVLPAADYRASLLASYDDGQWIALLLDDVDGRFPDLDDPSDARRVWDTVARQCRELTPPPPDLPELDSLADTARRDLGTWRTEIAAEPERYLPTWAISRLPELIDRIATVPERLPSQSLCHWDLRDDNLLIRADGSVVIVDWGSARPAPAWADLYALSMAWAGSSRFDAAMTGWPGAPDAALVTELTVLQGGRLAWLAGQPVPPGLPPSWTALVAEVSRELLAAARRRLGG